MTATAKKSLGQHFLTDSRAIQAIVAAGESTPRQVIEIGPGRGAITQSLRMLYDHVTLVEKDRILAADWRSKADAGLHVVEADATEQDWIDALDAPAYGVIANLPYNAATVIMRRLLYNHTRFPWMVLMFQREVADRFVHAGARKGGAMGVLAGMIYQAESVLAIGPDAFRPPPKVDSQVVRFTRLDSPLPGEHIENAWRFLTQVFQRRRARLDKAVTAVSGRSRDDVASLFAELDIRADARPDHVSPDQYRQLLERLDLS